MIWEHRGICVNVLCCFVGCRKIVVKLTRTIWNGNKGNPLLNWSTTATISQRQELYKAVKLLCFIWRFREMWFIWSTYTLILYQIILSGSLKYCECNNNSHLSVQLPKSKDVREVKIIYCNEKFLILKSQNSETKNRYCWKTKTLLRPSGTAKTKMGTRPPAWANRPY